MPDAMHQFNSSHKKISPMVNMKLQAEVYSHNKPSEPEESLIIESFDEKLLVQPLRTNETPISTFEGRITSIDAREGQDCNIYDQSEYSSVNTKVKNIPFTDIKQHYIG